MRYRFLLSVTILLLALGGCRHHEAAAPLFTDEDFCLKITPGSAWERKNPGDPYTLARFEVPGTESFFIVGAKRDSDLLFTIVEHNFSDYLEYARKILPSLLIDWKRRFSVEDVDGLTFEGTVADGALTGFYFNRNAAEYFLVGVTSEGDTQSAGEFRKALQSLQVCRDEDLVDKAVAGIRGQKPLTDDQIRDSMAYGRELLRNRDVNVENYELAMKEFRKVLAAYYGQQDPPLVQEEALSLLELTSAMRDEAFREHRFLLEQNLALRDRNQAVGEARYLLRLVPESDDQRHSFARKMYGEAASIRLGEGADRKSVV